MITAIELALNHLDHAELVERVDVLAGRGRPRDA
jgi:hypothetical protein